jgi:thiosulfate/3-mercaptopyruvate sulfurtransferase
LEREGTKLENKTWFLIFFIILLSGCISETVTTSYNGKSIADSDWVEGNLEKENVKIISAMAMEDSYIEGHIPGSLYVDYKTDIVDLDAPVQNTMASKEKVQDILRRLGIKNSDAIIIYDDTNNMIAARMYNVLRFYGHKDLTLLNGGKTAWASDGREFTLEVPGLSPSDYIASDKSEEEYVELEYVYNNLRNPDILIVDVRPTDQYTGENVRLGIGRGGGHIAGAINIPGSLTWNDDKTIKSPEELEEIYETAGLKKDKRIIVYCHSGMLASYSWYVLTQLLEYPDVALYDGSSLEWTNHPTTPIVKGSEPGVVPKDLLPL